MPSRRDLPLPFDVNHRLPFGDTNMFNCFKLRQRFFDKYQSIDADLLIFYWIIAGYIDHFNSVVEAYEEGHRILGAYKEGYKILRELTRKGILYEDKNKITTSTDSTFNHCSHQGHCRMVNLWFDELLDLRRLEKHTITNGMVKDEKDSFLLLHADSLEVLENVKNLSVLLLKGRVGVDVSFENLRTLTVLEIRFSPRVTDIPWVIFSELTQLQCLDLSVKVEKLPDECFSKLKKLRWLILRNCAELYELPSLEDLSNLEVLGIFYCLKLRRLTSNIICSPKLQMLDLSSTGLTSIPELETTNLTHLFLRRWKSNVYRKFKHPSSLQELDISHRFPSRSQMKEVDLSQHHHLVVLDLSRAGISSIDSVSDKVHLRKLILVGCKQLAKLPDLSKLRKLEVLLLSGCLKLDTLDNLASLSNLIQLDLSDVKISSSQEFKVDFLQSLENLQILNLSGTSVAELPGLSKLTCLKTLLLADCEHLTTLPDLKVLINLERLEISVRNHSGSLQNLAFTNPFDAETYCAIREAEPFSFDGRPRLISNFVGIITHIDRIQDALKAAAAAITISTTTNKTNNHRDNSTTNSGAATSNTTVENVDIIDTATVNATTSNNDDGDNTEDFTDTISKSIKYIVSKVTATANNSKTNVYMWQLEKLRIDMEYINEHTESMLRSPNGNWAKKLMQHLVNAINPNEFVPESPKFKQLVHDVAKLKLLVPRTQTKDSGMFQNNEKKKDKENVADDIVKELVGLKIPQMETSHHLSSYESLTNNQKQCLLCFSVFPCDVDKHKYKGNWGLGADESYFIWKSLQIKKKILIYWWVGEGFIDLHWEENFATNVSEQVTLAHRGEKKKPVEEIGEQILKVLTEKGFIEPVIEKGRDTGRCQMHPFVHSFVVEQAKKAHFFDFSNHNSSDRKKMQSERQDLTIIHTVQQMASLHYNSQCPDCFKSFQTVQTLFNFNESIINIEPEYFSKMKDLSVLHLGNWQSETTQHIEVEDQKFLEDLKNMKRLKLFSLQGVSTIVKLPDSICKVSNLIILDLRECHDLEELPAEIGSLKNLTHLDITNCHLLSKLPKGISLLSKLEVLKGFVIYDQSGDLKDKKASILDHWWKTAKGYLIHDLLRFKNNEICTLRDLLKLENLRKLSIVVNNKKFPDNEDLKVFKEMENLRKLMISWVKNLKDDDKRSSSGNGDTEQGENKAPEESFKTCQRGALAGVALEPQNTCLEAVTAHKSLDLMKCFKQQSSRNDGEKKSRREFLDHIEKLELQCFPFKSAPWLVPNELKNLRKLYIKGGMLEELSGGINGSEWKVTTLLLKYLPEFVMTWTELKTIFPNMTYLEKHECKKLGHLTDELKGVWRFEHELT